MPVLVTESGTALFESDAIIEFVEDEYGPLRQVSNEQRALERAWSYLGSKHYLTHCGVMSSKDEATFEQRASKLRSAFEKMEMQLSEATTFFNANSLGRVDIAWLPLLHRAAIIKQHSCYDFFSGLPKLQAWQQALLKTDLATQSVSTEFVDKFKDFYLTNTYLAHGKDAENTGCDSCNCC